jgi:hypothetical protein
VPQVTTVLGFLAGFGLGSVVTALVLAINALVSK